MKLSFYSTHVLDLNFPSPQEALKFATDRGVAGAVFLENELARRPFHEYCDLLDAAGLQKDGFVSLQNVAAVDAVEKNAAMDAVKHQVDSLEARGIPLLMIAPRVTLAKNRAELLSMRSRMAEAYTQIIEYARGSGITLAIENYSLTTRADSRISDLRWLFDQVPDLRFVLDTGNFYCVREDVLSAYDQLSDKLVQVHCKDWRIDEYGYMMRELLPRFNGCPLGEGVIPLTELLDRIARDMPDCNIMYEDNSDCLTPDWVDRSLAFLRKGWDFC